MPVAASMALKAASTGPSPLAACSTLRPSAWVSTTSARSATVVRASGVSSVRVQGPRAQPQPLHSAVVELFLAVGQRLELLEQLVELGLIQLEAERLHPLA